MFLLTARAHTPLGALGDAERWRQQSARGHREASRKGPVRGAAVVKFFETAMGLNQAASQASQLGPAAAAAGPPAVDGGGGGGTDAKAIELARKIFAMGGSVTQSSFG